jgi:cyanophycin synthetase
VSAAAVVGALARAGRPGREAAVRLDLLHSIGVREARRRKRDDRMVAAIPGGNVRPGYTRIWTEAAHALDAEVFQLSGGLLEIRNGAGRTRVFNQCVPLDDLVTFRLSEDKVLVHRLLTQAGLPVPEHARFDARDPAPALAFLERAGGAACVVKPLSSAGGSATTSGIRSAADLRRAVLRARRQYRDLLIERQVPGDVYRLLYLDGELVDAIRRHPPSVVGDGRSTIGQLVEAENRRRADAAAGERPWLLRVDLDAVLTLGHRGLRVSSVPPAGVRTSIKTAVSQNGPHDNEAVAASIGAELVADGARAARLVGVRLAGVDVITPDPAVSLLQAGGVVLEVNATPGLHYHYEVADPATSVPVAIPILRLLLAEAAAAA